MRYPYHSLLGVISYGFSCAFHYHGVCFQLFSTSFWISSLFHQQALRKPCFGFHQPPPHLANFKANRAYQIVLARQSDTDKKILKKHDFGFVFNKIFFLCNIDFTNIQQILRKITNDKQDKASNTILKHSPNQHEWAFPNQLSSLAFRRTESTDLILGLLMWSIVTFFQQESIQHFEF